jgi:CNT family concentrative nucleoside transporter
MVLIFSLSPVFSYAGAQPDPIAKNESTQIKDTSIRISDTTGLTSGFKKNTSNLLLPHSQKRQFNFIPLLRDWRNLILLALGFLFSKDRKNIPWKTVGIGFSFPGQFGDQLHSMYFFRATFEFFGQIFIKY